MVSRAELAALGEDERRRLSQFDAIFLSESKRALDRVPLKTGGWCSAFGGWSRNNARIKLAGELAAIAAERFRNCGRKPG